MNIDNTLVQKYAPIILSGLVLLIPAVNILAQNPSQVTVLQFVALLAASIAVYPLRAPWKQLVEVAGAVVAAALPLALDGSLTWANWALVVVAVVKAVATHLGVVLRRDPVTDAPIPAPQTVTLQTTPAGVEYGALAAALKRDGGVLEHDDALDVDLAEQQQAEPDDGHGRHEAV